MASLRKNVASQNVPFVLLDVGSGTVKQNVSVSGFVAKDGAAIATITGTIVSLGQGMYCASLSQADTNGNILGFLFTGTSVIPVAFTVFTANYDPTDAMRLGLGAMPNVSAEGSGGLITRGTGTGQLNLVGGRVRLQDGTVTLATFEAGAIGAGVIGSAALSSIADAVWDELLTGHTTADSAGRVLRDAASPVLRRAMVVSATSTSIQLDAGVSLTDSAIIGSVLAIVSGTGAGQARRIYSYVSLTQTAGILHGYTTTPDSTSEYALLHDARADIQSIRGSSLNIPTNGRVDAAVGTMNVDVTIGTSGIPTNAYVAGALTSISNAVWGASSRLLSADVTVGTMKTHVTIATSGVTSDAITVLALNSIADTVWEESAAAHTSVGTTGAKLSDAASAGNPWTTSITGTAWATGTAGQYMTRMDASISTISAGSGPTETSIATAVWAASTRLLSADVTVGTMKAEVSIATSGVKSGSWTVLALNSVADAVWGASSRLLSADVTVGTIKTHVTIATSGIAPTALLTTTYTSLGAAVWAASSRLLSADVTVGTMNAEVSIATGGLKATSPTAAAYTSIGNQVWSSTTRLLSANVTVGTMATEVSIATAGVKTDSLSSGALASIADKVWDEASSGHVTAGTTGVLLTRADVSVGTRLASTDVPSNFSSLAIDSSGRTDMGKIAGSQRAAEHLAESGENIMRGTVGSSSTQVSVVLASITPVVCIADQLLGAVLIFNWDTATTALRGQRSAITANSTSVLTVTSITTAPASGDAFVII